MGKFFQCDTGETFSLPSFLKCENECFVRGTITDGVLTINKVLWIK